MRDITVSLVGGLTLGATYALLGCGLVLIFRSTQVLNFAHGHLMLVAAYVTAVVATEDGRFVLGVLAGIAASVTLAVVFYWLVLRRMTGLPHFMPVIATIGLASVVDAGVGLTVGAKQYVLEVPGLPTGRVSVFGTMVSQASVLVSAVSLVVVLGVLVLTVKTSFGRRLRAAGQDPLLASQSGINVHAIYLLSWALAAVLAAIAGIAFSTTNIVGPGIVPLALLAFPAILLGGLDSIGGSILGGLGIGIMQGFVATYFGGDAINAVTYAVLLGILLLLPSGLFGTVERNKL
jgi:branched-chain amino acid transport system permease protein